MALGDLEVKGKLKVVGTTEMAGFAKDATLITNLNADKVDSADLDTDGALTANSDVKIPSQKAVKTYADTQDALKANDNAVVKLTGDQTVAGVKTFSSQIVGEIDSTDAVRDQGTAAVALKCKMIEIGDWNMDATPQVNVTHGLDLTKIREVTAMIRRDDNALYTDLKDSTGAQVMGQIRIYSTVITLARTATIGYDEPDYNSTSYNRGWVIIWYVA
jgi:hypothetical protein